MGVLVALARKQQYKMKFLVLAAFLGCVAAEADPALFYGNGLTYGAGVYGGLYGGALGYAGYAGYPAYTVAAPVARTVVSAPVTTTYTRSYTLPSVYSGYGRRIPRSWICWTPRSWIWIPWAWIRRDRC